MWSRVFLVAVQALLTAALLGLGMNLIYSFIELIVRLSLELPLDQMDLREANLVGVAGAVVGAVLGLVAGLLSTRPRR